MQHTPSVLPLSCLSVRNRLALTGVLALLRSDTCIEMAVSEIFHFSSVRLVCAPELAERSAVHACSMQFNNRCPRHITRVVGKGVASPVRNRAVLDTKCFRGPSRASAEGKSIYLGDFVQGHILPRASTIRYSLFLIVGATRFLRQFFLAIIVTQGPLGDDESEELLIDNEVCNYLSNANPRGY